MVFAGTIPIHYLAEEREAIYNNGEIDRATKEKETRASPMQKWQEQWNAPGKGGCTRRLIKNLQQWITRGHGEINYHLTQFLTEHGCFNAYLDAIEKAPTDGCRYCQEVDTAEHAIFTCTQWNLERRTLTEGLEGITPDNIIPLMLSNKDKWDQISRFIENIMKTRIEDEAKEKQNNHARVGGQ